MLNCTIGSPLKAMVLIEARLPRAPCRFLAASDAEGRALHGMIVASTNERGFGSVLKLKNKILRTTVHHSSRPFHSVWKSARTVFRARRTVQNYPLCTYLVYFDSIESINSIMRRNGKNYFYRTYVFQTGQKPKQPTPLIASVPFSLSFFVCVFLLLSLELGRCSSDLFLPSRHVPDWQPRILLGMVEARSVNVKKTTTTTASAVFLSKAGSYS